MGRSNMAAAALVSVVLLGLARSLAAQAAESGWRTGRGTYYGNEPWLWSIHEGSCGYGYIWPDEPLGWDVAAMPDAHYEFDGSCGRCYEVACDPMVFRDNYGNELDRGEVCHDPSTSVVVRVTDTCPCNYGDNYYSNKRWCCGDMDHLDLSVHTFEKLADMKWGVIGIKYRPVPCDYSPVNAAPTPANPFPGVPPPPGAQKPWPPRFVTQKPNTGAVVTPPEDPKEALTPAPTEPEAMAFSLDSVLDGADAEEKTEPVVQAFSEDEQKPKKKPKKVKANKEGETAEQEEGNEVEQEEASEEVTQEEVTEEVTQEEAPEEVAQEEVTEEVTQEEAPEEVAQEEAQEEVAQKVESKPALKGAVLAGDIDDAWTDSSWLVEETNGVTGPTGNMAHCKKISPGGAIAFSSYEGKFDKTISMEFWVKTDMGVPDLNINLEGPMGPCRRVKMQELAHSGRDQGGFVRYDLYLGLFDRTDDEMNTVHAFSSSFLGCGGNAVTDVNKIEFKNDLPLYAQEMCIDGVRLMAA